MGQEHNRHFDQMYRVWVNMLVGIIPQNTDIGRAYEGATSAEDQDFVQNLALFLTAFFKVAAFSATCSILPFTLLTKTMSNPCQKLQMEPDLHDAWHQGGSHAEDLGRYGLP